MAKGHRPRRPGSGGRRGRSSRRLRGRRPDAGSRTACPPGSASGSSALRFPRRPCEREGRAGVPATGTGVVGLAMEGARLSTSLRPFSISATASLSASDVVIAAGLRVFLEGDEPRPCAAIDDAIADAGDHAADDGLVDRGLHLDLLAGDLLEPGLEGASRVWRELDGCGDAGVGDALVVVDHLLQLAGGSPARGCAALGDQEGDRG